MKAFHRGGRAGPSFGILAAAGVLGAAACTQPAAPPDTVTVQSALDTNVVVTVVDNVGAPQFDVEVTALLNNGSVVGTAWTNAGGQVTFTLPANSYRFAGEESGL